jgi:TPR repeat protein
MVTLGEMFEKGEGISVDMAEAARWYREALELGNANGAEHLARLHRDGRGMPKDIEAAKQLYQKAIELVSMTASRELEALRKSPGPARA